MTPTRRDFLRLGAAAGLSLPFGRSALAFPHVQASRPAGTGKKVLVLGGTGFIGPHIVEALIARGHVPTLFNRGKSHPGLFPNVEKLHGDRKDKASLDVLKGRTWDAAVDTAVYFPRIVREVLDVLNGSIEHYVFVSTISVYPEDTTERIDESTAVATIADETTEKVTNESYGPLKALSEKAAEAAMPGKVAVARPGLIVGPGDPTGRFSYWPVRVARGGDVLAPGAPTDPVQFIDARDLAEWIVKVIEDRTVGVYNATGPVEATLGIGKLLEACNAASGGKAKLVWGDAKFLEEQKVAPWSDMPVWVPPPASGGGMANVNVARAKAKGLKSRPVETICRDTLAWWNGLPAGAPERKLEGITAEREAKVLEALRSRSKG